MKMLHAAAIIGGLVLSVPAAAQTPPAPDLARQFPDLLAEARKKVPSTSEVGTINTTLSTAEWAWSKGNWRNAVGYLDFARGRLGLSLIAPGKTG
ncbi:hypothetical protein JHL17_07145 [Azospirillum sp. YIM B02556]|uniref:Uncharacterized protein n=1 Tax=Azospirillum endophyticum TaxID=2800326 RepID=A0ABS1F1D7_9PROT|nr:hypothetical protein [Azospirillum endophyticum]MBK1837184.1 hypothetical protein [Azospirillum endophyticum]